MGSLDVSLPSSWHCFPEVLFVAEKPAMTLTYAQRGASAYMGALFTSGDHWQCLCLTRSRDF